MYVVLVYDVNSERCEKVLKVARKYLNRVQNSVLEGELSYGNYKKMVKELRQLIDWKKEGSAIFYTWPCRKYAKREYLGKKTEDSVIII